MSLKVVRAYARTTDPVTSHEAAEQATDNIKASQRAVLRVLRDVGPSTHKELWRVYRERTDVPTQAYSGMQTRVIELVRMGLAEDTGMKKHDVYDDGHMAKKRSIIWRAL